MPVNNGSPILTFADLDGDDDLDAFANETKYARMAYYQNTTGASVTDWSSQPHHNYPFNINPYLISNGDNNFIDLDNDGDLDFIFWSHDPRYSLRQYWKTIRVMPQALNIIYQSILAQRIHLSAKIQFIFQHQTLNPSKLIQQT